MDENVIEQRTEKYGKEPGEEEAQQLVDNGLAGEDSALLQEIISMLKDHIDNQDMQVTDIYEE